MVFLWHADVATNVASVKARCHVSMYIHATWRTHMRVCMCVHVCAHVISEIKHPFHNIS